MMYISGINHLPPGAIMTDDTHRTYTYSDQVIIYEGKRVLVRTGNYPLMAEALYGCPPMDPATQTRVAMSGYEWLMAQLNTELPEHYITMGGTSITASLPLFDREFGVYYQLVQDIPWRNLHHKVVSNSAG